MLFGQCKALTIAYTLIPKAEPFFTFANALLNFFFAKSSLALGAGDAYVHGGCAAVNRGADYVAILHLEIYCLL